MTLFSALLMIVKKCENAFRPSPTFCVQILEAMDRGNEILLEQAFRDVISFETLFL